MSLKKELRQLAPEALAVAYVNMGGVVPEGATNDMDVVEPLMPEYAALGDYCLRLFEQAIRGDDDQLHYIAVGAALAFRSLVYAAEHPDDELHF